MRQISVIKHGGQKEAYDPQKVLRSILRSKVNEKEAQRILSRVEGRLYDQIPTEELYRIVGREMVRRGLKEGSRLYQMRESLALMDSIDFEKFVKEILAAEGFESQWNKKIDGGCIDHQIDVIAKNKQGDFFFVEVKHHRNYHRDSDLGNVVELWGRLEDLLKGYQLNKHEFDFRNAWLITNTKFSEHAKKYATCKRMRLTGWRYALSDEGQEKPGQTLGKQVEQVGEEKVLGMIEKVIGHQ